MSTAAGSPSPKPVKATAEGTRRYAARFAGRAAAGHFREQFSTGIILSSIGIGTYLGEPDAATDAAYTAAGIPTANVAGAFRLADVTPTPLAKVGMVPQNVASECAYTWMCTAPPWGPDDHPNNAGYAVIASEIEADLPKSWQSR